MPRNPAHPWVGESVALDFANPVSGAPFADFGGAIRYRVRDDGSSTISATAPDAFIAGFYDSEMLLSGDAVVASFVVVCSGDGTLRLSGGYDADWTLDDPADASIPFGDFTVAPTDGVVEFVGTFPSFDVDTYLAETRYTVGMVECVAGAVTIEQVKLRLWPPGGPPGGWATTTSDESELVAVEAKAVGQIDGPGDLTTSGVDTGNVEDGSAEAAWGTVGGTLRDLLNPETWRHVEASGTPSVTVDALVQAFQSVSESIVTPGVFIATAQGRVGGALIRQPNPMEVMRVVALSYLTGEYGLDFVRSPDEVPGDMPVKVLDPPTTTWDSGATLTTTDWTERPDGPGPDPSTFYHVTEWPAEQWTDPADVVLPLPGLSPDPVPTLGVSTGLALPDARLVLLSLSHEMFQNPDLYAGTPGYDRGVTAIVAATIGPSTVTIPPFQYWSPTAASTVAEPLRLRQRTDGLGLGSTRVRGAGSRQHSTRVRGYL